MHHGLLNFIIEAKQSANDIIAFEFSEKLKDLFDSHQIDYSETLLSDFDSYIRKVKDWIEKKGKQDSWKDVEIIIKKPSKLEKGIKFVLGVKHGYYGFYDRENSIASKENIYLELSLGKKNISFIDFNKISPKKSVRKLLRNGQIPELIQAINAQIKSVQKNV